jgi:hypothetical protein
MVVSSTGKGRVIFQEKRNQARPMRAFSLVLTRFAFFSRGTSQKNKRRRLSWHIHTPINLLRISDNHLKTQLQVKLSMNSTLTRHPESLEEKTSIPLFISSIYIW